MGTRLNNNSLYNSSTKELELLAYIKIGMELLPTIQTKMYMIFRLWEEVSKIQM